MKEERNSGEEDLKSVALVGEGEEGGGRPMMQCTRQFKGNEDFCGKRAKGTRGVYCSEFPPPAGGGN